MKRFSCPSDLSRIASKRMSRVKQPLIVMLLGQSGLGMSSLCKLLFPTLSASASASTSASAPAFGMH